MAAGQGHSSSPRTAPASVIYQVTIQTLGQFEVYVELSNDTNHRIQGSHWGHGRAKDLFFLLLCQPNRHLPREVVARLLWPELDVQTRAKRLNNALWNLRTRLNAWNGLFSLLIDDSRSLLRLHAAPFGDSSELMNGRVCLDTMKFEQACRMAESAATLSDQQQAAQLALDLYVDNFLPEAHAYEWITSRRQALRNRFLSVGMHAAHLWQRVNREDKALDLLYRLFEGAPERDDLARALMLVLIQLGRTSAASDVFVRARRYYRAVHRDEPIALQQLHDDIRAGKYFSGNTSGLRWPNHSQSSESEEPDTIFRTGYHRFGD